MQQRMRQSAWFGQNPKKGTTAPPHPPVPPAADHRSPPRCPPTETPRNARPLSETPAHRAHHRRRSMARPCVILGTAESQERHHHHPTSSLSGPSSSATTRARHDVDVRPQHRPRLAAAGFFSCKIDSAIGPYVSLIDQIKCETCSNPIYSTRLVGVHDHAALLFLAFPAHPSSPTLPPPCGSGWEQRSSPPLQLLDESCHRRL